MDRTSNPGSATPETLYRIYKDRAAVTANPYVLREMQTAAGLSFASTLSTPDAAAPHDRAAEQAAERESLLQQRAIMAPMPAMRPVHHQTGAACIGERRRANSPPRGHFKVITHCGAVPGSSSAPLRSHAGPSAHPQCRQVQSTATGAASVAGRGGLQLTLNSLDMSRR